MVDFLRVIVIFRLTPIDDLPSATLPGAKLLKKFDQNFCLSGISSVTGQY